ncbi:MAG TPA: hypothetical protein VIN60_01060, partial [Anaerolineales bacterium]
MRKLLVGFCILMLAALACNFNVKLTPSPQPQSAIATIVAETMRAVATASSTPVAVLNTPTLIPPSPSPSPTPMAVIKAVAFCRSGPGENYKSFANLNSNQNVVLLGKDPTGQYWLIQIPSGTCWVAAQFVTVTGDTKNVPEMTPPPVTTSGIPAGPGSLFYQYSCGNSGSLTTQLTWVDSSNNESGFHVYRNSSLIATLPANSTSYTDTTTLTSGSTITYGVTAYNDFGESAP